MHSATVAQSQDKCHGYSCYIILNQLETSSNSLYALRPLVAPSLRSECYSLGPSGLLKCVETLDSVSNYCIVAIHRY